VNNDVETPSTCLSVDCLELKKNGCMDHIIYLDRPIESVSLLYETPLCRQIVSKCYSYLAYTCTCLILRSEGSWTSCVWFWTSISSLSVFLFFLGFPTFSNCASLKILWVVEMHIWCIKILNVLASHFNPWVESSAGGMFVPEGLYSPVAKYFCTCFKLQIWIELLRKNEFYKFIS
jgi:hypothetical protein